MGVWKLAGRQDQFDSPLPAVFADEGMEKPGAFANDLEVWAEYANGLVYIDRSAMALGAVGGYPLTGLLEVSEGPIDGRLGHEKRGKPAETLDFLTTLCYQRRAERTSEMTREQMQLLHNLTLNGGRLSLSLHTRAEFAPFEEAGWLHFQHGNISPYMEITDAGRMALDAARFPSPHKD